MRPVQLYITMLTMVQTAIVPSCVAGREGNRTIVNMKTLLANYDPLELPVTNSSQRVYLNISMGLKGFIELDMKKQTLVSFGWLTIAWYDEFLRWNPNQYPFHAIYPYASMIWRPDLVIYNTVTDLDQLEDQKTKMIIEHTGKVVWYPGGLFQTSCSINIFHYPLDTQVCYVQVSSWAYDHSVLNATLIDPAFDVVSELRTHPEWELIRKTASYTLLSSNYWTVNFSFTLRRKVLFYILNMVLPIFFLSLMSCLVFLLPANCGEKMTVSVTMFLSFAVFLSLINNSLPTNSDTVCLFSVYVAVQMFISVCSIVTAACIVFLHGKDQESDDAKKMAHDISSDSRTNANTDTSLGPASTSRWSIWNHFSLYGSEASGFSHPSTETTDVDCNTKKAKHGGSVHGQQKTDPLSIKQVWMKLTQFHHLRPHQRKHLSRQLDLACLKLSLAVNILTCFIFSLFWFVL